MFYQRRREIIANVNELIRIQARLEGKSLEVQSSFVFKSERKVKCEGENHSAPVNRFSKNIKAKDEALNEMRVLENCRKAEL